MGNLKTIIKELQGASKMHLRQSKEIAEHINDMGSPTKRTNERQSLQTQYRELKAKAGNRVRKFFGQPNPVIKPKIKVKVISKKKMA